jgi:hypothetical protein
MALYIANVPASARAHRMTSVYLWPLSRNFLFAWVL